MIRASAVALAGLLSCSGPAPDPTPASPRAEAPAVERPVAAPPRAVDSPEVRMDGHGRVRFGMTLADVEAAIGERIDVPREGCHVVAPSTAGTPAKFTWLVQDGVLARIDVTSPAITAVGGGRVGSTADELRKAYAGTIVEAPHKYDPKGQTWTVGPAERAHFVFELDGAGRVGSWRAGVPPQIDWVERCG
ncbi:MAG TPA: hypothetical protein VFG69_21880 [Nannocystaceae bacterium]|nr:hypothetical protein [Nannocystaceae bacterium]